MMSFASWLSKWISISQCCSGDDEKFHKISSVDAIRSLQSSGLYESVEVKVSRHNVGHFICDESIKNGYDLRAQRIEGWSSTRNCCKKHICSINVASSEGIGAPWQRFELGGQHVWWWLRYSKHKRKGRYYEKAALSKLLCWLSHKYPYLKSNMEGSSKGHNRLLLKRIQM